MRKSYDNKRVKFEFHKDLKIYSEIIIIKKNKAKRNAV